MYLSAAAAFAPKTAFTGKERSLSCCNRRAKPGAGYLSRMHDVHFHES